MCLIFTCGEHTFRKEVEGYEGITCQCHNCGNYSGKPIIPLSIHGYEEVSCHICNFAQPLENRQDVQQMKGGGGGQQGIPMQNQGGPPQGWGGQQGGPPQGQQPMQYK